MPAFSTGACFGAAVTVGIFVCSGVFSGFSVITRIGTCVGVIVGVAVGLRVGGAVGLRVGVGVGLRVGVAVGFCVGVAVGFSGRRCR